MARHRTCPCPPRRAGQLSRGVVLQRHGRPYRRRPPRRRVGRIIAVVVAGDAETRPLSCAIGCAVASAVAQRRPSPRRLSPRARPEAQRERRHHHGHVAHDAAHHRRGPGADDGPSERQQDDHQPRRGEAEPHRPQRVARGAEGFLEGDREAVRAATRSPPAAARPRSTAARRPRSPPRGRTPSAGASAREGVGDPDEEHHAVTIAAVRPTIDGTRAWAPAPRALPTRIASALARPRAGISARAWRWTTASSAARGHRCRSARTRAHEEHEGPELQRPRRPRSAPRRAPRTNSRHDRCPRGAPRSPRRKWRRSPAEHRVGAALAPAPWPRAVKVWTADTTPLGKAVRASTRRPRWTPPRGPRGRGRPPPPRQLFHILRRAREEHRPREAGKDVAVEGLEAVIRAGDGAAQGTTLTP